MVDFTRLAATATRLIAADGRDMTIVKESRDPADPSKPWRGNDEGGVIERPVTGAVTRYCEKEIDGEAIKIGDCKIWIGVEAGYALETFDYIDDGDVRWSIQDVKVIKPADTVVAYRFQVRNG